MVSYFLYPYQDSRLTQSEWRIFDPATGNDVLFLAGTGGRWVAGFESVRWDTTFRTAYYNQGDSLYQVDWQIGAKPRLIGALPNAPGREDWWFNPDSSCWQLATMNPIGSADTAGSYRCELWQSSPSLSSWRLVRSETISMEAHDSCWHEEAVAHRIPTISVEDLNREMEYDWGGRALPFDTSTVMTGSNASPGDESEEWFVLPFRQSPRWGLAFRQMASDEVVVSGPYFWVDLEKHMKKPIAGLNDENEWWSRWLAADECGVLLLSGRRPIVVEERTGNTLFSRPWNSRDAAWIKRPGPSPRKPGAGRSN